MLGLFLKIFAASFTSLLFLGNDKDHMLDGQTLLMVFRTALAQDRDNRHRYHNLLRDTGHYILTDAKSSLDYDTHKE